MTYFALYEAYGTRPYEWGSDPDRQKANTKEEEKDLGLLDEGMRYRDLETGTFLTRDPIGYGDGPNVYCYVHCNPITHFDAWGLETQSESKSAAEDWYNSDDYDGDEYDSFDDYWANNEQSWYTGRANEGYNVFTDDYKTQVRWAIPTAQKELFERSASTRMKETLDLLAHSGELTPDHTDKLKGIVNTYVKDDLAANGSLNLTLDNDAKKNDHGKWFWKDHGVKDAYEVYVHGCDFANLNPKDVYTLMSVNGYKQGTTVMFVSCDGFGLNRGRTESLSKEAKAKVKAGDGVVTYAAETIGGTKGYSAFYGWTDVYPDGSHSPEFPKDRANRIDF